MSEASAPQAANRVTVEIDGTPLEAEKGEMLIRVADRAGIPIPRFCYHRKLSVAANCRMCLVDVEKAPKPLPACATPVMDGMKVYTRSKRAMSAQQNVMEFLLINHPLDCPICDQGGECELQDVSMGFGRSVSRFTERKRVVPDENLGSLISTDMTRCIHCTRCVRFLEEIAGTNELGGIGRGEATQISTFIGRSIDSELSGNIIDLCPVGALTNKPYRYTARAWELRSQPSVAPHDAVGSNLHYHRRRGRIMRAVPRDNEAVNETWLADRDRWGFHGLYGADRAERPALRDASGAWQEATWDEAIDHAAALLRSVPADEVGFLLSPRATNEELYLAQKLARAMGVAHVDHRLREVAFEDDPSRPPRPRFERPIAELRSSDAILLIGTHLVHDQPILGHQVRQAALAGGRVAAINAKRYGVNFPLASERVVRPSALAGVLAAVARAAGAEVAGPVPDDPEARAIAELLGNAERPVILVGSGAWQLASAPTLRALASVLAEATGAALCEVPPGANTIGAWQAGAVPHRLPGGARAEGAGLTVAAMVEAPRQVYLTYDFEPDLDTAYGLRLQAALAGAKVVHLGAFASEAVRAVADLILPLAPAPECEGSFTNLDGRIQSFEPAANAPGDARAGWKVLRVLGNALGLDGFAFTRCSQVREEFVAQLRAPEPVVPGERVTPTAPSVSEAPLELLAEVPIYAVDGLVRRAEALQRTAHGEAPSAALHPHDAGKLGLEDGALAELSIGGTGITLAIRVDDRLPEGVVRVPLGVAPVDASRALEAVRPASGGSDG